MKAAAGGDLRLVVSGLAQGDDPSGGLSVARCIRAAFPDAHITGMDYSVRGAALHDPVFDDVVIHRPWGEFETDALRAFFAERLAGGALILSTIDLEAYWLAHHFPDTPAILSAGRQVFPAIAKPPDPVPELAGLALPAFVHLSQGLQACHAFLRRTGFRAWLKGPFHDALRVSSWEDFDATWERLAKYWPYEGTFLQEDITGTHEAIAFAAWQGRLLDAVWIVKNDMTTDGKTVAGTRREVSGQDRQALESYIARLAWHGGGEIELIRDGAERLWLLEINARFPSWVAGGHLLGANLPARLVAQHQGVTLPQAPIYEGFVRVQNEIPTRAGFRLLEPVVLEPGEPLDAAKTAFNIHELARHLKSSIDLPVPDRCKPAQAGPSLSGAERDWLTQALCDGGATPRVEIDRRKLATRCQELSERAHSAGDGPGVEIAYSMKTNPDPEILTAVCSAGLGIEVISPQEYDTALRSGFEPSKVVVNGPGKQPDFIHRVFSDGATLFADSINELGHLKHLDHRPDFVGMRLCPPEVRSRFGIPLSDPGSIVALTRCLAELAPERLGIHMHIPQSAVGTRGWHGLVEALADFALTLCEEMGADLSVIDLGGGWYPEDLEMAMKWLEGPFSARVKTQAPRLERLIMEPGRAVVQDCQIVVSSVLEIRDLPTRREVVIDASLAEVSEAGHYPHPIAAIDESKCVRLIGPGSDRLLGRTCMEDDVIATRADLSALSPGNKIAILDAGSYDRSMSYDFGKG